LPISYHPNPKLIAVVLKCSISVHLVGYNSDICDYALSTNWHERLAFHEVTFATCHSATES